MQKRPVLVVAEQEHHGMYLSLLNGDERVEAHPLGEERVFPGNDDYDLVILDCGEDAASGLTFLEGVKQTRPDVPVIFLTSRSSEETAIRAFRIGAREYLRKPLPPDEIRESVAKILSIRRDTAGKRIPLAMIRKDEAPEILHLNGDVPDRLLRAIQFIEINLPNQLSLDRIAQEACLSKFHFCRMFKKHVGVSPIQFMLNLRIYRATILLRCTDLTISAVAVRAGFSDLSEFYKQFKKINGMTPSEFREAARIR